MDIKEFIKQTADVLEVSEETINAETKYRELEQWDSIANLSFVAMIDIEYGVVIETEDLKQLTTLGEVFAEILNRK